MLPESGNQKAICVSHDFRAIVDGHAIPLQSISPAFDWDTKEYKTMQVSEYDLPSNRNLNIR